MRAFVAVDLGNSDGFDIHRTLDGAVLTVRSRGSREVLTVTMNEYQLGDLKRALGKVEGKTRSCDRKPGK